MKTYKDYMNEKKNVYDPDQEYIDNLLRDAEILNAELANDDYFPMKKKHNRYFLPKNENKWFKEKNIFNPKRYYKCGKKNKK